MSRRNDFRLTGVSGTPVMTADNTALSTIFLSPYKGNIIALFNGTIWELLESAEVSIAVTGRTTDLPFDIFAFNSGGVVALELLNWATATTRATGLTRQNGVWCQTGNLTRRYVGSCRPRSATTYSWSRLGAIVNSARFDLWNVDNRVMVDFRFHGSGTHNYTLATWRQTAGVTDRQVDIMVGISEDGIEVTVIFGSTNTVASVLRYVGVGIDSTTAPSGFRSVSPGPIGIESIAVCRLTSLPGIGRHFFASLEWSTASGVTTWLNSSGQSAGGASGLWRC